MIKDHNKLFYEVSLARAWEEHHIPGLLFKDFIQG